MKRTLSAALTMILAFGSWAHAQSSGTIYYTSDNTLYGNAEYYAVGGDGSTLTLIPTTADVPSPSGRSDYPGGRLFLGLENVDTIPGTTYTYVNLVAKDLTGVRVQLTAFAGPLYVRGNFLVPKGWSNDSRDTFFYFQAYDPSSALWYLYRANVTGQDIIAPGFVPLAPGDARLQLVLVAENLVNVAWSGDATKIAYSDSYLFNGTRSARLRIHAVGPDISTSNDTLLNDTRLSNINMHYVDYSPVSDQLVVFANDLNVTKGKKGPSGVALYTRNGGGWAFSWLQQTFQSKTSGFEYGFYPTFSPDGTAVAFSGRYYRDKLWQAAILRCSVAGGPFYVVTEAPLNNAVLRYLDAWRW